MTRDLPELRHAAREIFDSALQSADPRQAVQRAVSFSDPILRIHDQQFDTTSRKIFVVAIGKAAHPMAQGLVEILADRVSGGLIAGPPTKLSGAFPLDVWQIFAGGHPLPTAQSLAAGKAALSLMQRANTDRAIVIFLISGGGSAMIEWPSHDGITLDDLRQANRELVCSEATIKEINSVRRAFSAIKGGRLASQAWHTTQINLIVSDVNSGEEETVASGPTLFPPADVIDPAEVVDRHRLKASLPESVAQTITHSARLTVSFPELEQFRYVILDNQAALMAAAAKAKALGFYVKIDAKIVEQPIEEGCKLLLSQLGELRGQTGDQPLCLLSGGEFRCPVRGNGQGGRNSETVLRCAIELDGNSSKGNTVVLSGGTDGIDGNSPAAGAVGDQSTVARGRAASLDAPAFLAASDSFSFFNKLDDAIVTGPTSTNVRDLRILLARR